MLLNQLIYIIIRLLVISITKHMLFVTGAAVTGATTIYHSLKSVLPFTSVFLQYGLFDIYSPLDDTVD